MSGSGQADPWDVAISAQDERTAGLPPRPLLTRTEAITKANDYLHERGCSDVAVAATPNPLQGLWIVEHHDPSRPDELVDGGGPLVVPTNGPVYEGRTTPPWPEYTGLEEPESWAFEGGEDLLPEDWMARLRAEFEENYWDELLSFVARERGIHDVFPPPSQTFAAFNLTSFARVRVVILGQDPYPNVGEAHGLAFSVPVGVPVPPSLRNIHKELESDLDVPKPNHGNLGGWAEQGVLLLNTALTVRAGSKKDRDVHRKWRSARQGWTTFTDAAIKAVGAGPHPVVFILWGKDARKKKSMIDLGRHHVIESAHPSPLSAYRDFFNSRPFSRANEFLRSVGRGDIDWSKVETSQ